MKPIHKLNNGQGATLCNQCSLIISLLHTEDIYCKECKEHRKELLQEDYDRSYQPISLSDVDKETIEQAKEMERQKDAKYNEMLCMLQSVLKLQKENYGSGMDTHLAMITKAKEIEQLIKEATEI